MTDEELILERWNAQLDAMDAGDTAALRACFTPDAHLVHMTGRVQPLDAWMAGIRAGRFVHHRIERRSVRVESITGGTARLTGHVTTGISDDGSGRAWPLTMTQTYERDGDDWLCSESRVALDR